MTDSKTAEIGWTVPTQAEARAPRASHGHSCLFIFNSRQYPTCTSFSSCACSNVAVVPMFSRGSKS